MSFSSCFKCNYMVLSYEKYCQVCLEDNPSLKQDENYWRTHSFAEAELERKEAQKQFYGES